MYWSFTFILGRVLQTLQTCGTYSPTNVRPASHTLSHLGILKAWTWRNQCGHHMETSCKTVTESSKKKPGHHKRNTNKDWIQQETLCAIEESEKIKIKMKRRCKVWPTRESKTLHALTREKPWTIGPSCSRGRGGSSTRRAKESM